MEKELKSKTFEKYKEALDFAREHKGVVEGPFVDLELNNTYIAFYREGR